MGNSNLCSHSASAGIVLKDVGHRFGNVWAIRHLDLEVHRGEVVGLLGPNGAGKSTSMRIITSNLIPTEGVALVNGTPVNSPSIEWKYNLGYLPEANPLYPDLMVREYLLYVANLYHLRKPKVAIGKAMERTGLLSMSTKRIGHLSKGYKQRVGLAATIVAEPSTLILDEPTNGLDPNQMVEIRHLIRDLAHSHAILLSSHIMQEVEVLCDKVVILSKGQVITQGETKRIISEGETRTVIVAFAQAQGSDFNARKILQQWCPQHTLQEMPNQEWAIHGNLPDTLPEYLFSQAASQGYVLKTLYQKTTHLEDVFQALTNTQRQD